MIDYPRYKVRPSKRGSRPRTKIRPDYSDLPTGWVISIDRGRFQVLLADADHHVVTAMRARELGRQSMVVGEQVRVQGDLSGAEGTLARIVELLPRNNYLMRSSDDTEGIERDIVANIDQILIVCALVQPPARIGMIDRCLVAAYHANLPALICFTKRDLGDDPVIRAYYDKLKQPYLITSATFTSADPDSASDPTVEDSDMTEVEVSGLAELNDFLHDRKTVFIGHSGVGKSTLVNAVVPDASRQTGEVNVVTGRGRHTSTSAVALPLPDSDGWVIDTPGVRSFGLAHLSADQILEAYPDLDEVATACERGCTHLDHEPDCSLDAWQGEHELRQLRVSSFRRIVATKYTSQEGHTHEIR